MFPLHDENPTCSFPFVTLAIVAANALAWVFVQGLGSEPRITGSICTFGLIPAELLGRLPDGAPVRLGDAQCVAHPAGSSLALLTSMFMHGGWLHIVGNLWFLWVFGDNVEDELGHGRYALFYPACGLVAALAEVAANPASEVPMVGASGAIGGVMGAYAVLHPRARVHTLFVLVVFVRIIPVPAIVLLGYWFALQLVGGGAALGSSGGGVAFWAHAGGFLAGAACALPLRGRRPR
ncbi:MAG: rhomboid family intramembrane serine protease [Myxococcota bacterium]|nr:rhomboid family intramembrane serine protease [Myxococcota bacterium]